MITGQTLAYKDIRSIIVWLLFRVMIRTWNRNHQSNVQRVFQSVILVANLETVVQRILLNET